MEAKSLYQGWIRPLFVDEDRREYQNVFLDNVLSKPFSRDTWSTNLIQQLDNQRIAEENRGVSMVIPTPTKRVMYDDRIFVGEHKRTDKIGIDFMTQQPIYAYSYSEEFPRIIGSVRPTKENISFISQLGDHLERVGSLYRKFYSISPDKIILYKE